MLHIDDILIVSPRKTALEELIPSLQAKYTVCIEIMSGPGDEVTFLKKAHQLLEVRRMVTRIHSKHLDQLASCFICQNVCRTNALLATVKLRHLTRLRS